MGAAQLDGNAVHAVVHYGHSVLSSCGFWSRTAGKTALLFSEIFMRVALSMAVLALSVSQLAASSSIYVEPASVLPNQFPPSKGYNGRASSGRNRGVGVTRKLASKR